MKKEIERSILKYLKDKKMDENAKTTDLHTCRTLNKQFSKFLFNLHVNLIRNSRKKPDLPMRMLKTR